MDSYGRSTGYTYARGGSVQQTVSYGYGTDGRLNTAGFTHGGEAKQFSYAYLPGTHLLHTLTMPNKAPGGCKGDWPQAQRAPGGAKRQWGRRINPSGGAERSAMMNLGASSMAICIMPRREILYGVLMKSDSVCRWDS